MKPATLAAVSNIQEVLGADAVKFLKFRFMIEAFEKRIDEGETELQRVIDVIHQLSRLIDLSQRETPKDIKP